LSMVRCENCENLYDTDYQLVVGNICESCFLEYLYEEEEEDAELS
jgi:hypothetical protein